MHPRGFPKPGHKSGISPISPWPGYPNIPIFLDTREEVPHPNSRRTTVTSFDTTESRSPVSPLDEKPPLPPPKGTPSPKCSASTTLQIPSSENQFSEKSPSHQTERSPVRHLSPVEYPSVDRSYSKPRTPRTPQTPGRRPPSRTPSGRFHASRRNGYVPLSSHGEKNSGLGIIDESTNDGSACGPPRYPGEEKPSLNFAERIEDRLWQYSMHGNVFKRWLLEAISWSISAVCMAVIIGVLSYLKDQPLRRWPLATTGITLNTFVATLSRIASAALLLPVSEALGQLKWIWFFEGKSKKMWDFEIFDNASRGPWGSFQLLLRTKGRKLAALGAAIVLFALALDPFFQQILDFPNRWTLMDHSCTLPRVGRYEPNFATVMIGGQEAATKDGRLASVASEFFFGNGTSPHVFANGTVKDFPVYCPTSNCTWPVYETLGVCSKCTDVSELLTFACMETAVDWISALNGTGPSGTHDPYPIAPVCGYFLNATSENPVLMSGYAAESDADFSGEALLMRALPLTTYPLRYPLYGDGSIKFKEHRNPILDVVIAGAVGGAYGVYQNRTPVARECVLSWCVKTMQSSYTEARYEEKVVSTFINTTKGPFPWISRPVTIQGFNTTYIEYLDNLELDVTDYPLDPETFPRPQYGYGVSRETAFTTINVFDVGFPSFATSPNRSSEPLMRFDVGVTGPPMTRPVYWDIFGLPSDLDRHMDRFAEALTDSIRAGSDTQPVNGTAYDEEAYISVRWEWITLPVSLLLFSLVFLLLTIFKTSLGKGIGVWKNSGVATLLYGFPDDMQKDITSNARPDCTPRTHARELKVKLGSEGRWRISGHLFSPRTSKAQQQQALPGWI